MNFTRGINYINGLVTVGDMKRKRVLFIDPETKNLVRIMLTPGQPYYICTCNSGLFAITYQDENQVLMYDCNEHVIWNATMPKPRGCVCDDTNTLLVASRGQSKIYRISNEGNQVTVFHDLDNVLGYSLGVQGDVHKLNIRDDKLYYVTEFGTVYIHNL